MAKKASLDQSLSNLLQSSLLSADQQQEDLAYTDQFWKTDPTDNPTGLVLWRTRRDGRCLFYCLILNWISPYKGDLAFHAYSSRKSDGSRVFAPRTSSVNSYIQERHQTSLSVSGWGAQTHWSCVFCEPRVHYFFCRPHVYVESPVFERRLPRRHRSRTSAHIQSPVCVCVCVCHPCVCGGGGVCMWCVCVCVCECV